MIDRREAANLVTCGKQGSHSSRNATEIANLIVVQVDLVQFRQEFLQSSDTRRASLGQVDRGQIFPVGLERLDFGDDLDELVVRDSE